jgi:hypothetical protein
MAVTTQVLFGRPQQEIATLIVNQMARASATSIVTGFLTPGGLAMISKPISTQPLSLKTLVVGAATYPGFEGLDQLLAAGVPPDRLHVHLGHTSETGGRKNPFARYHPMLHSKVYYMESASSTACAFIGSHNVTSFALAGLNGEAAIMLEGPRSSPEFEQVRSHIEAARSQAIQYSPTMKEAYAWWMREFIDGLRAEMKIPQDWITVRTILLFAIAATQDRPKAGDHLYFEIPAGIEQIESLKTETHLFLFDKLPSDPWQALNIALSSDARYTCKTLGAENLQGNMELKANWRIEETPTPILRAVPGAIFRPVTGSGKQQVRAEVQASTVVPFEYLFERARAGWDPQLGEEEFLHSPEGITDEIVLREARGDNKAVHGWKLVKGLVHRQGSSLEKDQAALKLASPDSGSFILVALRRRRTDRVPHEENQG